MGCGICTGTDLLHQEEGPSPFQDGVVRTQFIKRVYIILSIILLIFIGIACLFVFCDELYFWVTENRYLLYIAAGLLITACLVDCAFNNIQRSPPYNYILLSVYTLTSSFLISFIACFYAPGEVFIALALTLTICIVMTLLTLQKKFNYVACCITTSTIASIILITLIVVYWLFFRDRILRIIFATIGIIIFSLWVFIDTQMIMTRRWRNARPDDYMSAAVSLFGDIILMFYFIILLCATPMKIQ